MSNSAMTMQTLDGSQAVASVAYRLSEVIAIYPITPSSNMGEHSDEWAAKGMHNLWNTVPQVSEMQSEGGAAGAVHGALQAGALSTTFTASQGLLLMIPNMFKIAGELTSFVMHVSARTLATHALSIFGDHSDVMACRSTGFAMLAAGSVQEAQDFAAIAHAATLKTRIPFLHFFDGFRTSHEVAKIAVLSDDDLRALIDEEMIAAHRRRALSPDHPVLRGTAQNPDVFFQAREAGNSYYDVCPEKVKAEMDRFAKVTGRQYRLYDYVGHPQAERVIIMMGSGAEAAHELVDWMVARGEKVGLLKVRLFRPFATADFIKAIPRTARTIAVLDRTKEPGAFGDPLYLDVVAALHEAEEEGALKIHPRVIGGRYGLSSKEFNPAMVRAVYEELAKDKPQRRFTVGIVDDVTGLSLPVDYSFDIEPKDVVRAVFYGLGADGTVGANKNSIKIIGEETDQFAQGYFVYDSKKSGAITTSHLRFGPRPIQSSYLIRRASFVAVHQWNFFERYDVLEIAAPGGTLLINSLFPAEKLWAELPREVQQQIIDLQLKVYTIDAYDVARRAGMGGRVNTVMQTCFFALAAIFPREEAIDYIKRQIKKTYAAKGEAVVNKNYAVVDDSLAHLHEVKVPATADSAIVMPPTVSAKAPDFVQRVTAVMLSGKGDGLPVSAFPVDGTWPTATTRWEKRNLALEIPQWHPAICIQCNKCAMVCPHAAIRAKVYPPSALAGAPATFQSIDFKGKPFQGQKYTLQVAPEDCTGCRLCVEVCPAKDKQNPRQKAIGMVPQLPLRVPERDNYEFFLALPEADRNLVPLNMKGTQFFEPLFEYSGACSGCGETPYVKLLTQLFGDRALIANATGCSSIYGGNLPTTPYTVNREGRGPAWSNSLFEDNAEFGFGYRLAVDQQTKQAQELLQVLAGEVGDRLVGELLAVQPQDEAGIAAQRVRVLALREQLKGIPRPEARRLELIADYLVKKSVWIVGGDGWAYDIGYGGLDHVLASGRDVNILVMDTEVYSNTGGQASKATPTGAAAKFAAAGKSMAKKDLGLLAMSYGSVYVAQIAFGANDAQVVKAFAEAEAYPGPSLIIAFSHCIAHGYDLAQGAAQQKLAVDTGYWPLYRYDPRRNAPGESPLRVDSPAPSGKVTDYTRNETRFRMVEQQNPERFKDLMQLLQNKSEERLALYAHMALPVQPIINKDE
ncbi:Pyruvate-flavodoxin oxidoreductase [Georgfuchsia toluolica]|uniref:Pyruvate-flavodoxin oxidoreductase n=1 Tax=Georgfuchsia toluolica TaxID=424218 RepID=A0A916J6J9_9PROT|nr:pyruvate:ferredoxin (flavodoxin) oxidoreductase [Georgfuchsia toluolica]CAG4884930.1 Pyruvate-flavodoxin oxidoreductase [Georgfuchsia toluolica]